MAQTKDNTAYKIQILDEYNNPYSPITSIYSLYYIDNTENNNIRKKPTVLSKINISSADGQINSNSILNNYCLLTQNGIKDTETSGINGDSVLHEYTVQSVSLAKLLNTSEATNIIAPNVNQWISQNNITYFKLKNLGIDIDMPLPAILDDVPKGFLAGGQNSNEESVLYYKSDTGNKSWKLEIPSTPDSNNHIKLSGQNNISKEVAWTSEIKTYTTTVPLGISTINPHTGQPQNSIILNYADPFTVSNGNKLALKLDSNTMGLVDGKLKCTIQPGNNGTTYAAGNGIAIGSETTPKISVKLASSNSGLTFENGGLKCTATGGTTYTPGNGINITNGVIKAVAKANSGIKIDTGGISCKTLTTSGTTIDSVGNVIINPSWFTIEASQLVIGKDNDFIDGIVSAKPISASAFYSTSDIRKKMDIKPIENDDNIPEIVEFKWKSTGKKSYGFIAQDLQEDYPELINDTNPELLHMDYMATLSLVIGKLQAKIKKLEQRIIELENKETV